MASAPRLPSAISGAVVTNAVAIDGSFKADVQMTRLDADSGREGHQPLSKLSGGHPPIARGGTMPPEVGSDDEPFIVLGIPAVELNTEPGDYDTNHHAITDTLDKVDPRALSADTAGMALAALAVATSDPARGRRLQAPEILELLTRTNNLDEVRLLRGDSWVPQ